jgi:hypothetical protein
MVVTLADSLADENGLKKKFSQKKTDLRLLLSMPCHLPPVFFSLEVFPFFHLLIIIIHHGSIVSSYCNERRTGGIHAPGVGILAYSASGSEDQHHTVVRWKWHRRMGHWR